MILVMWQLIIINLIILGLDIYVLEQEFAANVCIKPDLSRLFHRRADLNTSIPSARSSKPSFTVSS
jgi:hypothetical protein